MVELTVELFVNYTMDILPKVIENMADAFKKHKKKLKKSKDPFSAMAIFMQIMMEIMESFSGDYLPEGITNEQMEKFKEEHDAEINEYLENSPEVKEKWDAMQKELEEIFQKMMS